MHIEPEAHAEADRIARELAGLGFVLPGTWDVRRVLRVLGLVETLGDHADSLSG